MKKMNEVDIERFGLSSAAVGTILASPTREDLYHRLFLTMESLSLSKDSANPCISDVAPVNALALLEESVSLSDIQKMDSLANHLGLTQSELVRRWAKVLLYFLGYITNPAPI